MFPRTLLTLIALVFICSCSDDEAPSSIEFINGSSQTVGVTWSLSAYKYPPLKTLRENDEAFVAPGMSSEKVISIPVSFDDWPRIDTITVYIVKRSEWNRIYAEKADSLEFDVYNCCFLDIEENDWAITYPDNTGKFVSFKRKYKVTQ